MSGLLSSLAVYLGAAALATLAGRGLLRCCRAPLSQPTAWLLAAPSLLAAWTVVAGLAVAWGWPLRGVALPVLAASALLALAGLRGRRARPPGTLLLAVGLPASLLAPHFVAGLRDCSLAFTGDGWAYVADAQRLWEPSATGALSFLHAWARTLSDTRHASASLLALLSPVGVAGDPQRVLGLYCALVLFAGAGACGALARRLAAARPTVFLLWAVPAGWVGHVWAFANYDQGLALALLPALWALLLRPARGAGGALASGLLLAAVVHAYAELSPVLLAGAALVLLASPVPVRARVRHAALALLVAGLGLAPVAVRVLRFLGWQLASVGGPRPGGLTFAGLLEPGRALAAPWGLGGEVQGPWPSAGAALAWSALLSVLALLGAARVLRTRARGLVLVAALHVGGAAVLLLGFSYHYGAYKLLALGFGALALLAWQGSEVLGRRRGWPALLLGLVSLAWSWSAPGLRGLRATGTPEGLSFAALRELAAAAEQARPTGIAVEVADPATQQWLVYFLRRQPLELLGYRGYLTGPSARLRLAAATRPAAGQVDHVLSDRDPAGHGLALVAVAGPVQLARLGGDVAWLGLERAGRALTHEAPPAPGPAELTLFARHEGQLELEAGLAGLPPEADLVVRSELQESRVIARDGRLVARLAVPAGATAVKLEPAHGGQVWGLGRPSLRLGPPRPCARLASAAPAAERASRWLLQEAGSGAVAAVDASDPRATPLRLEPAPPADLSLRGSADLDGDGQPDLVFQDGRGAARLWLLAPGTLALRREVRLAARPAGRRAELGAVRDVDGDGLPDLLWQDTDRRVLEIQLGCGEAAFSGTVAPSPSRPVGPSWRLTAAADFDGAGWADLVWQHPVDPAALVWLLGADGCRRAEIKVDPPDARRGWQPLGGARGPGAGLTLLWAHLAQGRLVETRFDESGRRLGSREGAFPRLPPGQAWQLGTVLPGALYR